MPKCKSCGRSISWPNLFRNPLLLKTWRVLGSHLTEILCLECIASWNTYYAGWSQQQRSLKKCAAREIRALRP